MLDRDTLQKISDRTKGAYTQREAFLKALEELMDKFPADSTVIDMRDHTAQLKEFNKYEIPKPISNPPSFLKRILLHLA
jgi:hypothetical protein